MSRAISMRLKTLSALDAIADGSQAKAYGLTDRLHDVAARYAALLASAPSAWIVAEDLPALAAMTGLRDLPVSSVAALRAGLVSRLPDIDLPRHVLEHWRFAIGRASHVALIGLVERLEEIESAGD